MTLDSKILRGLFEHERLKLALLRTSEGNSGNSSQNKAGNKCRILNLIIIGNLLEFVYLI